MFKNEITKIVACAGGILLFIGFAFYLFITVGSYYSEINEKSASVGAWENTPPANISIFGFSLGEKIENRIESRILSYEDVPKPYKVYNEGGLTSYLMFNEEKKCSIEGESFNTIKLDYGEIHKKYWGTRYEIKKEYKGKCFKIAMDDGNFYPTDNISSFALTFEPSGSLIQIAINFFDENSAINFANSLFDHYKKSVMPSSLYRELFHYTDDGPNNIYRLKNFQVAFLELKGPLLRLRIPEEERNFEIKKNSDSSFIIWKGWKQSDSYRKYVQKTNEDKMKLDKNQRQQYNSAFN